MLFKQLLYFTTVAETLNISAAAKKLFISQPPISRQIILLEKELGVKLFIRKNKGLELTAPGIILYRQSKDLLPIWIPFWPMSRMKPPVFEELLKLAPLIPVPPF